MTSPARSLSSLRLLETLSRGDSRIHDIRPLAKLIATIAFLVALTSTASREVVGLAPLALYPILVLALSNLPAAPILGRLAVLSPLVLLIGALNPIFDRVPTAFGIVVVPGGWLVFASLAIKAVLGIWAAILLIATTGMDGIAEAMRGLKLPRIFVLQTLLAYRYLSLLMEEIGTAMRAHELRSSGRRGVGGKARGSLPGRLLVRTYERGVRIHEAMLLRGFDGEYRSGRPRALRARDALYIASWLAYFAAARAFDIPAMLGELLVGGRT